MGVMFNKRRIKELEQSGGGGGGDTVVVTPLIDEGTHIADIKVNGTTKQIFSPSGGASSASEQLSFAAKCYVEKWDSEIGVYYEPLMNDYGDQASVSINLRSDGHLVIISPLSGFIAYTQGETPVNNIVLKSLDLAALQPVGDDNLVFGIKIRNTSTFPVTETESNLVIFSANSGKEIQASIFIPTELLSEGKKIDMIHSNSLMYFTT